jgi:hypothetical protein
MLLNVVFLGERKVDMKPIESFPWENLLVGLSLSKSLP